MTNRSDWLENVRESSEKFILLGDITKLPVTGEGDVLLRSRFGELKLKGVLLVKDLSMNLIKPQGRLLEWFRHPQRTTRDLG
ncbi:hypothetical protein CLOM_g21862 [Closterium sp. NIES-68]|nr:hypothetical protein CLOM_g21862 [Closterium sp. NIES-68]GJP66491.1 hypothetical protein CLOP_g23418 [Closterium sp. NIES-67]GJP79983.1 hypothetical protein CLOP_g10209 [Closterium sp. NIES-67]